MVNNWNKSAAHCLLLVPFNSTRSFHIIKWIKLFIRGLPVLEAACTTLETHLSGGLEGFPALHGSKCEARKCFTAESNHSLWNFEKFPSDNTQKSHTVIYFFFSQTNSSIVLKYSITSKCIILSDQWTHPHPEFVMLQASLNKAILEWARSSRENEDLLMWLTLFECVSENKKKWEKRKKNHYKYKYEEMELLFIFSFPYYLWLCFHLFYAKV